MTPRAGFEPATIELKAPHSTDSYLGLEPACFPNCVVDAINGHEGVVLDGMLVHVDDEEQESDVFMILHGEGDQMRIMRDECQAVVFDVHPNVLGVFWDLNRVSTHFGVLRHDFLYGIFQFAFGSHGLVDNRVPKHLVDPRDLLKNRLNYPRL